MKWDGKLPSGFQLLLFSLSSTCSQLGPAHTHACMGVGSNTLYFLFLVLQTLLFLHCMHHLSVGTENSIYKYSSVCWGQDQCEQTVSSLSTTVEWKTWKERLAPSQKKDVGVMRVAQLVSQPRSVHHSFVSILTERTPLVLSFSLSCDFWWRNCSYKSEHGATLHSDHLRGALVYLKGI